MPSTKEFQDGKETRNTTSFVNFVSDCFTIFLLRRDKKEIKWNWLQTVMLFPSCPTLLWGLAGGDNVNCERWKEKKCDRWANKRRIQNEGRAGSWERKREVACTCLEVKSRTNAAKSSTSEGIHRSVSKGWACSLPYTFWSFLITGRETYLPVWKYFLENLTFFCHISTKVSRRQNSFFAGSKTFLKIDNILV